MEIIFNSDAYDRLEIDPGYTHGLSTSVVAAYRSRLQLLRAARDQDDLAAIRSLGFCPVDGRACGQHSVALNNPYCLIVEILKSPHDCVLRIVEVRAIEASR